MPICKRKFRFGVLLSSSHGLVLAKSMLITRIWAILRGKGLGHWGKYALVKH